MPRRTTKGRKAKSRTKAAKAARGRSAKTSNASKARKTTKAATRKSGGKRAAPATKKPSRKAAPRASMREQQRDVFGEGNYAASREFRREQTGFVQRNKARIPQMGERAAKALEGSEGNALRRAEQEARSHSAGDEE